MRPMTIDRDTPTAPPLRRCPRRCGSAPSTSPSPTSTAPSPGTRRRSACASTATTRASARAGRRRRDHARPRRGAAGAPARPHRRPLPLRAALPDARGARPRRRPPLARAHADPGRVGPRHARGDLPRPTPTATASSSPRTARATAGRPRRRSSAAAARARSTSTALLATIAGEAPAPRVGAGLRMGHLHLHVGDIDRGLAFYRDLIGFEVWWVMPSAAFVAAGGYHHHLGLQHVARRGRAGRRPRASSGCASGPSSCRRRGDVAAVRGRLEAAGVPSSRRRSAASSCATRGRWPCAWWRRGHERAAGAGRARPRRGAADRSRGPRSATSTCGRPTSTACARSTSGSWASTSSSRRATCPGWGTTGDILFLSAGGYHHHLGFNTWKSAGGPPQPDGVTGLHHVALNFSSKARLADVVRPAGRRGRPAASAERPRHAPRRLPRRPGRQRPRARLGPAVRRVAGLRRSEDAPAIDAPFELDELLAAR